MSFQDIIDEVWLSYVCNIHITVGATLKPLPHRNFHQYINLSAISKNNSVQLLLYLLIYCSTLWIRLFIDSATRNRVYLGKRNKSRHGRILLREIGSRSQPYILLRSE